MTSTQNITVNGLVIIIENHALTAWYRRNVIVGLGNFVIEAKSFHDFAYAMKTKLLREFSNSPISQQHPNDQGDVTSLAQFDAVERGIHPITNAQKKSR